MRASHPVPERHLRGPHPRQAHCRCHPVPLPPAVGCCRIWASWPSRSLRSRSSCRRRNHAARSCPLEQQLANQALHQRRLRIEHVNSSVKRCRIVGRVSRSADKGSVSFASRLRGVDQPVTALEGVFSPLSTDRWPACERKVSARISVLRHEITSALTATIIKRRRFLDRLRLGPRRHPIQQHLFQRPHVIRHYPPPSPVYTAATPSLSHGRWWLQGSATAGANWRGARQNCDTPGTTPTDPASPLRPGTGCSPGARSPPRAGGCRG